MLPKSNPAPYAIVYITRNNTENAPAFPLSEMQSMAFSARGLKKALAPSARSTANAKVAT
jgi:hypothetical protein